MVLVPVFPPNLQSEEQENETRGAPTTKSAQHDTMIFIFFTMILSVTNWQIMFVDPNKVATETEHTCSIIE